METQAKKPLHPMIWIAGLALIVFCGAGVASRPWSAQSAARS